MRASRSSCCFRRSRSLKYMWRLTCRHRRRRNLHCSAFQAENRTGMLKQLLGLVKRHASRTLPRAADVHSDTVARVDALYAQASADWQREDYAGAAHASGAAIALD